MKRWMWPRRPVKTHASKNQSGNNRFYKYIITYLLLIIFVTLLMAGAIYIFIREKSEESIIQSNATVLYSFRNTIDNFILANTDALNGYLVVNNNDIMSLFQKPIVGNSHTVLEVYKMLRALKALNPAISNIDIYYANSDAVISTNGLFFLDQKNALLDTGWIEVLHEMPSGSIWMDTRQTYGSAMISTTMYNIITLVRKYPSSGERMLGGIAFSIDEAVLNDMIQKNAPETLQHVFILDTEGKIVTHDDKSLLSTHVSGLPYGGKLLNMVKNQPEGHFIYGYGQNRQAVSFTTSGYNNWTYVSVSQMSTLTQQHGFLNLTMIFFVLGALTLGAMVLALSVRRVSRANRTVTELSAVVSQQNMRIAENLGVVAQNLWLNIINGVYDNDAEIKSQLDMIEAECSAPHFMVAVIKILGENTLDARTLETTKLEIIKTSAHRMKAYGIACYRTQSRRNVILIMNYHHNSHQPLDCVREICTDIMEQLGCRVVVGTGEECSSLDSIARAYSQALICIDYTYILDHAMLVRYEDILRREASHADIPHEYVEQFAGQLISRNRLKAMDVIYTLVDEIRTTNVPYNKCMSVLSACIASLEPLIRRQYTQTSEQPIPSLFMSFQHCEQIGDFVTLLENITEDLLGEDEDATGSRNRVLIARIKAYIAEHISRELITLKTAAEYADISPNYLSHIFKEETGIYFIDYLTEARLEMSKNMLAESAKSIDEIAEASGYSSAAYFNRKFKSRYGMTPKQYRTGVQSM